MRTIKNRIARRCCADSDIDPDIDFDCEPWTLDF